MMSAQSMQWLEVPATMYCTSVRDGTHDSPKFTDTGFPLITSKHLKFGQIDFATANLISEADFTDINRRSLVEQWDVLFSMIGTVGEVCLVQDEAPRFAIKNIGLFKCGNELKSRWLYYWFTNPATKLAMKQENRGASQQFIPLGALRSLQIRFPTNQTVMRKIIEILSTYDDLIENNRRRMVLLEESARLLYCEWFVRLRFPGYEHTRITDGLPQGWDRKPLGDSITLNYGKALKAEIRIEGDYPVYGSSGIVGTHEKPLVQGPAIILGRKGNVGSVYWSSKSFYPIDTVYFVSPESSSLYLFYALKNMHFISTDVAVPGLNRDFAYSRLLLHPPATLLFSFNEMVAPIRAQLDKLDETNQKLRAARDLLLPRLMSGELAV